MISSISLPGTHDSAAINPTWITPYSCHDSNLTQQLESGVRLLDIRLQITWVGEDLGSDNEFRLMTCHSDVDPAGVGSNVFQTFDSALLECSDFLRAHPSEFIAMFIKVDQWVNVAPQTQISAIDEVATHMLWYDNIWKGSDYPSLGDVRGHIYVLNRTGFDHPAFSTPPLSWPNNSQFAYLPATQNGQFDIYVQDKWENTSEYEKFGLWKNMVEYDLDHDRAIAMNFASGTRPDPTGSLPLGVYIQEDVISYIGAYSVSSRPTNLGWCLFDYENKLYGVRYFGNYFSVNVVDLWVDVNFGWERYPTAFFVNDRKMPAEDPATGK